MGGAVFPQTSLAYQLLLAGWGLSRHLSFWPFANIVLAFILVVIAAFTKPVPIWLAARELRDLTSPQHWRAN